MSMFQSSAPTLLIGLGGFGGQIAAQVYDTLSESERYLISVLCADTDFGALNHLAQRGVPTVRIGGDSTIPEILSRHPQAEKWYTENPLLAGRHIRDGSGQIRALSRLALLEEEETHRLKQAVSDSIMRFPDAGPRGPIRVILVGSICGGTSSGLGIALPFYLRKLIEDQTGAPDTPITGYFLSPDLIDNLMHTAVERNACYVNSYAFMRELNALYRAQGSEKLAESLRLEHYAPVRDEFGFFSAPIPYETFFLIERADNDGRDIGDIDDYLFKTAEIIRTQLIAAPVLNSIFDNRLIDPDFPMKRYGGAGIAKAIYPKEENLRWIALKQAERSIEKFWLEPDRLTKAQINRHTKQMVQDPTLPPLDPQSEYIRAFEVLTNGAFLNADPAFSLLKEELYVLTADDDGEAAVKTFLPDLVFDAANHLLKETLLTSELMEKADLCRMDKLKELRPDEAQDYVREKMTRLKWFEKAVFEKTEISAPQCTEEIFPAEAMRAALSQDRYNICAAIRGLHPLSARYILYRLRQKFLDARQSCVRELQVKALDEMYDNTIFTKDYWHEISRGGVDEIDHPADAIRKASERFPSFLAAHTRSYKELCSMIAMDAEKYIFFVKGRALLRLKTDVYSRVLERIDLLLEGYEAFFCHLDSSLKRYREEREALENMPRLRHADLYICADAVCKKKLYDRAEAELDPSAAFLPKEKSTALFDAVYKEITAANAENAFRRFDSTTALFKTLPDKVILEPLIRQLDLSDAPYLHMNILRAIEVECKIYEAAGIALPDGIFAGEPDAANEYYYHTLSALRSLASPYLRFEGRTESILSEFLFLNRDAAEDHLHMDRIDDAAADAFFGGTDNGSLQTMLSDTCRPEEMICYSAVLGLLADDLIHFRSGSIAYREYMRRSERLFRGELSCAIGSDDYLYCLNPHLDRNWHRHSFLPLFSFRDDEEAASRTRRAFLLAVACRYCRFRSLDEEELPRWLFTSIDGQSFDALVPRDLSAKPSYLTLFQAIDGNTLVVDQILSMDHADRQALVQSSRIFGADRDTAMQHTVIKGLIGRALTEDEIAFDRIDLNQNEIFALSNNLLDVIFSIYRDSRDQAAVEELTGALKDYIASFCRDVYDGRSDVCEETVREIMTAIGNNSKADRDKRYRTLFPDFFTDQ